MTPCPICQRSTTGTDLVRHPYIYGDALTLTRKILPSWQPKDGMCRTCVESIVDTVAEIEDAKAEQRPSSTNFNAYFRYTLSKREHGQWHHCNCDIQRWRQTQLVERVGDEAMGAGFDCWLVFDVDEKMLAQGIAGR